MLAEQMCVSVLQGLGLLYTTGIAVNSSQAKVCLVFSDSIC